MWRKHKYQQSARQRKTHSHPKPPNQTSGNPSQRNSSYNDLTGKSGESHNGNNSISTTTKECSATHNHFLSDYQPHSCIGPI